MAKKACSVKGCPRPAHALGFCRTHYDRHKKGQKQVGAGRQSGAAIPRQGAGRKRPGASAKCSVPACKRPAYAQGLCQMHYEARRKGIVGPKSASPKRACSVPGCSSPHHAKGYCKRHYGMLLRRKGGGAAGEGGRHAGLCEIAGCNHVATKNKRCDEHQDAATPDGKRLLTRTERLLEIHKRRELMRKEIERIKQSLASEREDD